MENYMDQALDLAKGYRGFTSPNPLVGAIVVKDGVIVGKGSHQKAREPHAEVFAIEQAGENAQGATLYVTLEPCSHFGKTPPCTELIIKSGIKKVITAMEDPNPLVSGRGHKQLIENGIEVVTNIQKKQALKLNEIFIKNITHKLPFLILKTAITLDGKIATSTGNARWISNKSSGLQTHKIRNSVDAVLVGKNTFLNDDPQLNVRLEGKVSDPFKIILTDELDSVINSLPKSKMFQLASAKPILICIPESAISSQKITEMETKKMKIITFSDLKHLIKKLFEMEICSIMLEGGAGVYTSFIKAGLVDKITIFQSTKLIGNSGLSWMGNLNITQMNDAIQLKDVKFKQLDDNMMIEGYL